MKIERDIPDFAKTGRTSFAFHRSRRDAESPPVRKHPEPDAADNGLSRMLEREIGNLTDQEITETFKRLKEELNHRGLSALTGGWDYQRETWGRGHLQFDPKPKRLKDGSMKVHGYWYFHYIVDGRRKSKYIGKDFKLAGWKEENPVSFDGATDIERHST